jgi:site-specific recombinase XerD
MENIRLTPLTHRGGEYIALHFPFDITLNKILKALPCAAWSKTHGCWYIPLQEADYKAFRESVSGKAILDTNAIRRFMEERKNDTRPAEVIPIIGNAPTALATAKLSIENKEALDQFVQHLKLKAYSASTIRTYRNELVQLLQLLKDRPVRELTPDDLKRYMVYAMEVQGISENTAHSRLNALKFYFEQVLGKDKFFWEIPRPKKPLLLPRLLNETELTRLFNALSNKKHKAMLFTAYSSGLRVSEIVNLKISDIDSGRMQILVRSAKGKKDRYVNLSPLLLDILRQYIKEYKPAPGVYLFESEQTLKAYPTRTVQQIFSNARRKAGIRKEVGIHSLRHSFATHLLDKGTDIRYIKDLLGHFNIRTTERYLHVSKKQLVNIISPFDDLWKKNEVEW